MIPRLELLIRLFAAAPVVFSDREFEAGRAWTNRSIFISAMAFKSNPTGGTDGAALLKDLGSSDRDGRPNMYDAG